MPAGQLAAAPLPTALSSIALSPTALSSTALRVAYLVTLLLAVGIATVARAAAGPPVLLVVGDSISAGYGLPPGKGWVTLLSDRMQADGYRYTVVNASISGDTTAGGRTRLPALLKQHNPAIVIIELGGNDALRGGDLAVTRANLDAMVANAKDAKAKVLIVGMQLPPNYGPAYVRRFGALFEDAAKATRVPFVPAFFAGFGEDDTLFQSDRIHPTVAAQPKLLDNIWPTLQPLLRK